MFIMLENLEEGCEYFEWSCVCRNSLMTDNSCTVRFLFLFVAGACYYDSNQSMYVFGGCTQSSCNAAFNDLWRLDLNSKEWIRPLASGENSTNTNSKLNSKRSGCGV